MIDLLLDVAAYGYCHNTPLATNTSKRVLSLTIFARCAIRNQDFRGDPDHTVGGQDEIQAKPIEIQVTTA